MIDHNFSVICSRVVIDKETNNVNIQNVLEQITIYGDPQPDTILRIELSSLSLWSRTDPDIPAQGKMRLSFVDPNGKIISSNEADINLLNHARGRNIIKFNNLPLSQSGRYFFKYEIKLDDRWKKVANIPIDVIFTGEEPPV